jgi:hypothetical protein
VSDLDSATKVPSSGRRQPVAMKWSPSADSFPHSVKYGNSFGLSAKMELLFIHFDKVEVRGKPATFVLPF